MTGATSGLPSPISNVAHLEAQLAAKLKSASEELSHNECLDEEQRAEIYAILEALQADTRVHRDTVGKWFNDMTGKAYDV